VQGGFPALDDFLARAQTILQRRKARSGRSLEQHTRESVIEEQFREGADFSHGPESDPGERPDFLFPSEAAYKDAAFPAARLRMLAVKTTCKDRIPEKHPLTLQEGVSEGQFREMVEAGVRLVVPAPLFPKFPTTVQPHLLTLESFIGEVRPGVLA
jgi:hypothetical protein